MNTQRLHEILMETTVPFRKGSIGTGRVEGGVQVMEVYDMPHQDAAVDGIVKVDGHFIVVGVNKEKAEAARDEVVEILRDYPEPERLAGGPSYIEIGGVLGDQQEAFLLFALGKVLGLWSVITPATLGFSGPEADQLAGAGMVNMSGFKE